MYVETSGDADVSIFIKDFSFVDEWAKAGVSSSQILFLFQNNEFY
jgi:hypothetical protein